MLPKNRLGRAMLKKLHVEAGAEHRHQAQKPVDWTMGTRPAWEGLPVPAVVTNGAAAKPSKRSARAEEAETSEAPKKSTARKTTGRKTTTRKPAASTKKTTATTRKTTARKPATTRKSTAKTTAKTTARKSTTRKKKES
jgi:hypothetical protein